MNPVISFCLCRGWNALHLIATIFPPFKLIMSMFRDFFSQMTSQFIIRLHNKSYTLQSSDVDGKYSIRLKHGSDLSHVHKHADKFDTFVTKSSSGNDIVCVMITPLFFSQPAKFTMLFSHGGTVDLGKLCNFLFTLGQRLCCNIFIYDYSGFGRSTGSPTEKAIYADADTALELLTTKYNIPLDQIVLYGQSLGTAATLHLASHHQVLAAILHSPFLSTGKLYVDTKSKSAKCKSFDIFRK